MVSIHRAGENETTPVAGYGTIEHRCRAAGAAGLVDVRVSAPGFVSDDGVRFGPSEGREKGEGGGGVAPQAVMSCHPSFLLPRPGTDKL